MIDSRYMISFGYTWFALFYLCVLVIAVTQQGNWFSRFLRNRPLMQIGHMAYGIYLIHLFMLSLCRYFISGNEKRPTYAQSRLESLKIEGLVILVALILTFIIAKLSWTYFEKPLVKRGHTYGY